jgi:hypothetical protein
MKPQTNEKTHIPKPSHRAAGIPELAATLGVIIPFITEPILETDKLSPNAKASSFPLNH